MVEREREDVFFLYTVSCRVSWCAPPPSSFSNFSRSLPPTPTIVYAGQYLHFTTVSWCVPPSHFLSNFNRLLPPPLPPSIVQGQYRHVLLKWVVGWGVWGGGILPSFLSWRNEGLPGSIVVAVIFMRYRVIFHPSKNDCVSLCIVWGVCGVLFLSCGAALSQFLCRWYVLR